MADESDLKDAKDELASEKERLVNEHLASAVVRDVLAPLERAVDVLEHELGLKAEAKAEKPAGDESAGESE